MKVLKMFLAAALFIAASTTAFSQQKAVPMNPGGQYNDATGAENPAPSGRGNALSEKKREEIRRKVETVRIWRLTEALKLDVNTSAKLASLLSSLEQNRRNALREQMEIMRELRRSLKSGKTDEADIKFLLDKIEKTHRMIQDVREQEWKGVQEILTIEQQARFLIFQQEFRREMQGMIAGARGNGQIGRAHV